MSWGKFWTRQSTERAGHGDQPPCNLSSELKDALDELDRLMSSQPELADPGQRLRKVLEAAFAGGHGAPSPSLDEGESNTEFLLARILEGWNLGVPAVRSIQPSLDLPRLGHQARKIARALGPLGESLFDLLGREPLMIGDLASRSLLGADDLLGDHLSRQGGDPAMMRSVLRIVLLAELGDWGMRLSARIPAGVWIRGDCPVCGSRPSIAESSGLEQRRFLRCDQCAAAWAGDRLRCPLCSNSDHRSLRSVSVVGQEARHRLAVCDACGGRIKVISTLNLLSPPALLVADLASVHLDFLEDDPAFSHEAVG